MRYFLLILIFIFLFQNAFTLGFIREFFFPRYPVLHRVRNTARSFSGLGVNDFVGLVESQGYYAEEHKLTTEDGYNLIFHRIPGSPISPPKLGKPVILLQHGIFSSSDSWVLMGIEKDLAFILADKGYDVWVGNARGNTYCRSHKELSTLDSEFWNFSYHEIGYYDLAAMIDYSLNVTEQKAIYYIGHSMGTTLSYVLLSTKPTYNNKIKLAVSLAPIAIWEIRPNTTIYRILRMNSGLIKTFLDKNDIYDLFPQTDNNAKIVENLCNINTISRSICTALIHLIAGSNSEQFNSTLLPHIMSYYPAGGSVQTLNHFAQNLNQGAFHQYDYGYAVNNKIYGKKRATLYDIKKITAPVVLIYSENDPIVQIENVIQLSKKLPNVVELYNIPNRFNHLDYLWARNAKVLLYDKILNVLSKY